MIEVQHGISLSLCYNVDEFSIY